MTRNQIKIKFDEFFGTGLWERDYKPHITVFTEQCLRESEAKVLWTNSEDALPDVGNRVLVETTVGEIYYGVYSGNDEFDLHRPDGNGDYRGQWFKYSKRTVTKWRNL